MGAISHRHDSRKGGLALEDPRDKVITIKVRILDVDDSEANTLTKEIVQIIMPTISLIASKVLDRRIEVAAPFVSHGNARSARGSFTGSFKP